MVTGLSLEDQRGEHFYSHLSKFGKFKAGDSIKTGDVVGYVGTTGTSTGPHLHWEFDTSPGLVGNQSPPSKVMDPYKKWVHLQDTIHWTTDWW